ncbi:glycerophosphodiester phosphodiesterase [Candidatus Bipolaricaulota bacterium]|nr:glycerophosphodiester phosphodiesterase [Candidatus Bipolaricaulota bacterium]
MRKNKTGKLLNIAHRGARSLAPENTLIAGRRAYEAGADAWEFDVRLTADEKLVVIHDETLQRTTNARRVFLDSESYRVDSFEFPEIERLDAGSWFEREDPFGEINQGRVSTGDLRAYRGAKVPSLREALDLTRELDWRANIELKPLTGSGKLLSEVLRQLVDLVEELGMEDDVVVSSFDHGVIRKLHNYNSNIAGALLIEETILRPVKYLKRNKVNIYNLPASLPGTEKGDRIIRNVNKADPQYRVNVWTVNKGEKMKELLASPFIDGVITDYPGRLSGIMTRES